MRRPNKYTIEAMYRLKEVLDRTGGEIRYSSKNVPHLVVSVGISCVSVCWFKRLQVWKTFFPWPGTVQRVIKWTPEELAIMEDYINNLRDSLETPQEEPNGQQ